MRKSPMKEEERDIAVLSRLCQLLRKNGDQILSGESRLSLTTHSLWMLGASFRRLSDVESLEDATASSTQPGNKSQETESWRSDVHFLHDFISKTVALKILHGTNTMQGAIQIQRFRSLQVLELKKVPVHMVEGIQKLRGQLKTVIVARSLESLQDLFETCGSDMSAPLSWPELKLVTISYNSLNRLDGSLRLLSTLEVLDVSHNNIEKTDNYLEYLTELRRLHFGYNSLSVVPTFSLSAKAKLKTLVLKNNCLDNLNGIADLTVLEELDVCDNCIADHLCLQQLSSLHMLRRLNTQGNPLYFHKNHRSLTLAHISKIALRKQFELDGKKTSGSETFIPRNKLVSASERRPSAVAHSVLVNSGGSQSHTDSSGIISAEYNFQDSDSIATSLPVTSSSRKKVRKRNKIRTKEISDSSATEVSSRESSRASSPERGSSMEKVTRTRQEVELLRDHYGPNWLQAIGNRFQENAGHSDASNSATSDSDNTKEAITNGTKDGPTDDDLYLKDSLPDIALREPVQNHNIDSNSVEPCSEVHSGKSGDVVQEAVKRLDSVNGIQWTHTEEEEVQFYGEESEPFIVMLEREQCRQLILTVNKRYLIEKDLNGCVVEKLDMRLLLGMEKSEGAVRHEDIEGEILLPHIKLMFDYFKKDKKERNYIMEDEQSTKRLEGLLQPFLEEREFKSKPSFVLQCLWCSYHFSKAEAKKSPVHVKLPTSGSCKDLESLPSSGDMVYRCPKCKSDKVIQLETSSGSQQSSAMSTPVGSYSSPNSFPIAGDAMKKLSSGRNQSLESSSPQYVSHSPLAKSTPLKSTDDENQEQLKGPKVVGNILHTMFDTGIERPDNKHLGHNNEYPAHTRHRSSAFIAEIRNTDQTGAQCGTQEVRNTNLSTINRVSQSQTSLSEINPDTSRRASRTRLASVDSDITILTNPSEGSIAVISESNVETREKPSPSHSEDTEDCSIYSRRNNSGKNFFRLLQQTDTGSQGLDQTDSVLHKGETTPMGSPLSNSICSSMVSSVYQNIMTPTSVDSVVHTSNSNDKSRESASDFQENNMDILCNTKESKLCTFSEKSFNIESGMKDSSEDLSHDESFVPRERAMAVVEHPFTQVDHRLKLHMMMCLFEDNEEFECILECDISQYLIEEEFYGIFVMSSLKFYILKVDPESCSEEPSDWLKTVDIQPVSELCHVDFGLGCQTFRLEFGTECSSYTFIIRDEEKCTNFVDFLAALIRQNPLNGHNKIDVSFHREVNATTLADLQNEVLSTKLADDKRLVKYLMGYLVRGRNPKYPISFVVTEMEIFLVKENLQWPQPRLQAPLSADSIGKHFTVLEKQMINNIATVEVFQQDKRKMKLTFFSEVSGDEINWLITMETSNSIHSLIEAVRKPWEMEFGVELDIDVTVLND